MQQPNAQDPRAMLIAQAALTDAEIELMCDQQRAQLKLRLEQDRALAKLRISQQEGKAIDEPR